MFLKLIRRDHVTHYGPFFLPLAVPIGVILAAFAGEGVSPRADGDYVGPVILIWTLVTMMLGFAQVGLRSDSFKLGLPLPARTVWLARLTSVVVFIVSILAVAVVFMVAFNDKEHRALLHGDAMLFLASLTGVMLLGVALVQSYRPVLREVPAKSRAVVYLVTVWIVCLGLLFSLASLGPGWTILPFVLAAVLFVRIWRRLPEAFVSVAYGAEATGTPQRSVSSTVASLQAASVVSPAALSASRWRFLLYGTVLRELFRPPAVAVIVSVILVFLGFYISGFYPEPLSGPVYMIWVFGFSPAFVIWPAKHVFKLDCLPISRRRIFPLLALPPIAFLCLGFVGGTILGNTLTPHEPLREYLATRDCPFYHRVPDRFLDLSWNGNPEPIIAPWGEAHRPWTCRPVSGRQALLYSPYSIPQGCSREYAAWQLSREIDDVYGVRVRPEDIVVNFDRYFETGENGTHRLVAWGDPLRADYPTLKLRDWGRPMAAIVLILGVVWFLTTAWIVRAYFSGRAPTFISLLGRVLPPSTPIVFVAIMIWLGERGYTTSWKLTAMANAMIRRFADVMPSNPLLLWSCVAVVLAAAYFLAEAMFRRAQVLSGQVNK